MGSAIVIAGTPGTGKSSVSEELSKLTGYPRLGLSEFAIERNLVLYFDEDRKSYVVDEAALVKTVSELVEGSPTPVIIHTHYPEVLPPSLVSRAFVLRTHPVILERRLETRGWDRKKVYENVMAEILGVVAYNALNAFGPDKVYEIDTSGTTPREAAEKVYRILKGELLVEPGIRIDWLTVLDPELVTRYGSYE